MTLINRRHNRYTVRYPPYSGEQCDDKKTGSSLNCAVHLQPDATTVRHSHHYLPGFPMLRTAGYNGLVSAQQDIHFQ